MEYSASHVAALDQEYMDVSASQSAANLLKSFDSANTTGIIRSPFRVDETQQRRAQKVGTQFRYSRYVVARFAACLSFMTISLIMGLVSLLPGMTVLAFGTLIAGLLAGVAGLSGAERAQIERARRAG